MQPAVADEMEHQLVKDQTACHVEAFENDFNRFFIAPTLTWQIGDLADLSVSLECAEDDEPLDFGAVDFGEGIADIALLIGRQS